MTRLSETFSRRNVTLMVGLSNSSILDMLEVIFIIWLYFLISWT